MSSQVYFTALTIAAAAESLIAVRYFAQDFGEHSHLSVIALIFAANYVILGIYYLVLYPLFISALRHLPGPKVSDSGRMIGTTRTILIDR
jgi:hypothetical protein